MAARIDSGSLETYGAVQSAGADIAVPDAALLFTGDYSRAGTDLILTGSDGAKFVVTGYFDTDTPPNLISPDGAMLTGDVASALAGPQFPGQYAQATSSDAQGAQAIGKVQSVEGGATVVRANGVTETLEVGDPVFQGDVVQTGPGAKLGIGFVDGTVFSLSANARMVLNNLVYNPDGDGNSMLFSLVEGTFVFAAGKIAPTGDMKINTPVATMGIRGTSGVVEIEAANGPTNFKLIPDPRDGHEGSYVLYNLDTGEPMGIVDGTGSVWRLTSADGTVTTFPKSEDELLKDAEAISEINSVYNSWTNSPDGPQAGPDNNPPSSGGFNSDPPPNTNQNENDPNNNNDENNTPPDDDTEQEQSGLPPEPPDFDDLPPLEEIPEDVGVNVINGTAGDDILEGTPGDDLIKGHGGNDTITAFSGDDIVEGGDGDDTIIAGTGEGDDHYDGGEGTDTIKYTSAENGVVINLVDSTVRGVDIGIDTIANIEMFYSGEGNDTLVIGEITLPDNFFWDAGGGTDTVLFHGALNVDTSTFEGDIENIEVVDLNKTDANTLTIAVDDFINHGPNALNALQINGDGDDTVNLTNAMHPDTETGFPGGVYQGSWALVGTENIDNVDFNVYYFFEPGSSVPLAIARIEDQIVVNGATPLPQANFESFENGFEPNNWTVLNGVITDSNSTDGVSSALISTGFLSGGSGTASLQDISAVTGVSTADLNALSTNESDQGNLTEGGAISTTFFMEAGQTLSFDWFFTTQDYPNFNDIAFVSLSGEPYELFDVIASGNQAGNTTTEGWNEFVIAFDQSGLYSLGFGVLDDADTAVDTSLLIDNIQIGSSGNPITVESGDGNDQLIGNSGDNILSGLAGNNTLTGNGGADTFVISGLDDGIDTITDYTGLDALDLSDLLATEINGQIDPGENLDQIIKHYVQAIEDGNGNVSVGVDLNGTAGGSGFDFTEVAVLQNVGTDVSISINIGNQAASVLSEEPTPDPVVG